MTAFYADGFGDRLVAPDLLPPAVLRLLAAEATLLDAATPTFDVLVEVGSMYGLHLDWSAASGKRYVGIDIVARYIKLGRDSVRSRGLDEKNYQLIEADAKDLDAVPLPNGRPLALYPFNSFGNMAEPGRVLDALARAGMPFAISSYGTDNRATFDRLEYYEACGYRNIVVAEDDQCVRFTAAEGLNTVAYHPELMTQWLVERGLAVRTHRFAGFGLFYAASDLRLDPAASSVTRNVFPL